MAECAGKCRRLRFSSSDNDIRAVTSTSTKPNDLQSLDTMTGGAFTAPTSGERAQRVRDWLAGNPAPEQMQEVFKELSGRDKGAARLLREKLDELKRAKGQEAIAAEWAQKAEALLAQPKLNIADALAWQRDAAKAGAPLSREPLAGFKARLAERVKGIEDLQHRAQVHREAAVLLAQRFEVLSTKSWRDAQAAEEALRADVAHWQQQAAEITADGNWNSLDAKFAPQLESSKAQLLVVSDAFHQALAQTIAAAEDAAAPLPPVPVWADELRVARGGVAEAAAPAAPKPPVPKVDPEKRATAQAAVEAALAKLEKETAEGHGKASAGAAAALRAVLKEHGKLVEPPLEARVHAALVAAGELEGWQRWRADQGARRTRGQGRGPAASAPRASALGGRKMQETLRTLRDQWKPGRPGRPAQPRAVEALRRSLHGSPQGGRGLAGAGASAERGAQGAARGHHRRAQGLDRGPRAEHRLENPSARAARLLGALARSRAPQRESLCRHPAGLERTRCTRRTNVSKPPRPKAPRGARH
jgi:ATP-dependent RNA helicase SUPV3L1/SUV3